MQLLTFYNVFKLLKETQQASHAFRQAISFL